MRIAAVVVVLGLALHGTGAHAEAPPDAEVARLIEAKGATLKWNAVPAGRSERYGHAEVLVDAPLAKVQAAATDFGHYKDFHWKFASARVIGKEQGNVDLYMKLPIKLGPIKIEEWEVMRFGPARTTASHVVVEGNGVRGKMKQARLVITARAIDAKHSLAKVDLLFLPSLPAPQGKIDEELRDGAEDFVNGIRDHAQGDNHVMTTPP
jgi:hypothetical protein